MARRKGLVRLCGRRSTTGIAHGCGAGFSAKAAIAAAEAEARQVAQSAGQTWIASQRCGKQCPYKHGWVEIGGTSTMGVKRGTVLSINKIQDPRSPGRIPPLVTFRVCIAARWSAIVVCNTRVEDVR